MIREVGKKLGLDDGKEFGLSSFGKIVTQDEEIVINKEENILDYVDRVDSYRNEDLSMDIVFRKDKVFVIFNYKKDMQQKISDIFGGYFIE